MNTVFEEGHMIEMSLSKEWLGVKNETEMEDKSIACIERHKDITYFQALLEILKLSVPAVLGMLILRLLDNINYIFIGHLDNPDYISGAGLAISSSNFLCYALAVGLAGGIDTLSSQAFGSKQNYLAGCYYNRAQVIVTVIFCIQAIALWNAESLLLAVGQPPVSSKFAAQYIKIYLPGIFASCQTELLRRFLSVQGVYYLILQVQAL